MNQHFWCRRRIFPSSRTATPCRPRFGLKSQGFERLEARRLLAAIVWEEFWKATELSANRGEQVSYLRASEFKFHTLQRTQWEELLAAAPPEELTRNGNSLEVAFPDPTGDLQRFAIFESPIMAPELQQQFPQIRTYAGNGIDDVHASIRFDVTPAGVHAQVLTPNGRWYVDPYYHLSDAVYASYYASSVTEPPEFHEFELEESGGAAASRSNGQGGSENPSSRSAGRSGGESSSPLAGRSGTQLRTYRTAVAATGEYTGFHGGTVPLGQAAIVTAINRVSGIYENELSIRLQLIANNNLLVYTNPATDPYTNDNDVLLLSENQANIDAVIGNANYDLGHVFTTGGGGLASLGSVGITGFKARGETGLAAPTGDPFYVDYVAHEMGHQFGGNHTFNGDSGSCSGTNRNGLTAYEPGSGSTIQAYAGICGNDDLQPNSDPYFHFVSFDEIIQHVDVVIPLVGTRTATGNNVPTINAGADFTIPASTPFVLTAVGNDADGTAALTYAWEQRDLGPQADINAADNGSIPLFRSFSPTASPSRTFPRLSDLVNNTTVIGERLPTVARAMDFRATVRDNRAGGGGVNTDDMIVNVVATGAPFQVTSPNTAVVWAGNSTQTVTWDVAGTTANGINTSAVRILMSSDGGLTYPTVLAANEANDGSATVTIPNSGTTSARMRVEAVGNIFFDISNVNFTVTGPDTSPPTVLSFSPPDNATGVNPLQNLIVTFNEIVQKGTAGNIVIRRSSDDSIFASIPVTSAAVTVNSAIVTIDPPADLALSTSYYVQIDAGSILDLAGNAFAGISTATTWNFTTGASTSEFTNSGLITINSIGSANPYPSTITVSGLSGTVSDVNVSLLGFGHTFPNDVDILLVGPQGQKIILMSDVGGATSVTGLNLVFDDESALILNDQPLVSGTFRPSNFSDSTGSDNFNAPAPAPPYGSALTDFDATDPNGVWSLFVMDDFAGDAGQIAGGWSLNIQTVNTNPALSIVATDANKLEGNTGTTPFIFTVTRSGNLSGTTTVDYSVVGSGANPATTTDFSGPLTGTLTFAPTVATQVITVNVVGDTTFEPDETFNVNLTNPAAPATITVSSALGTILNDDDFLTITLAAASILENGGSTTATVTRSSATAAPLNVFLTGNDATEATLPASVTIAAGQATSPPFTITLVNDSIADGTQPVTITALAANHRDGTAVLRVADDERPSLTLSLTPASISENGGIAVGTVTRNYNFNEDVIVNLLSNDITEGTVPTTLTIPANQASANFNINGVDDALLDGTQTIQISATAQKIPQPFHDTVFGDLGEVVPGIKLSVNLGVGVRTAPDGKLLIFGHDPQQEGRWIVSRYLANGTVDGTFGTGGRTAIDWIPFDSFSRPIELMFGADGTVTMIGVNPTTTQLVRLLPNGQVDSSFGVAGRVEISGLLPAVHPYQWGARLADGTYRLVTTSNTTSADVRTTKLLANGSIDPAYGAGGTVVQPLVGTAAFITQLSLTADERLVITGRSTAQVHFVARILDNGTLDPSFGTNGVTTFQFSAIAGDSARDPSFKILSDSSLLVSASVSDTTFTVTRWGVAKFTPSGQLDLSLNGSGIRVNTFTFVDTSSGRVTPSVDNTGRILLHGDVFINGLGRSLYLTRFLANGTDDPTFGVNGVVQLPKKGLSPTAAEHIVQSDGKLLSLEYSFSLNALTLNRFEILEPLVDTRPLQVTDDDLPTVTLSLNNPTITEASGVATVTATLSTVSTQAITVDLGFTGSATNSTDYSSSALQIVIPAGSLVGSITVTALQDLIDETDETVIVDILGVTNGIESGTQQVTTTIIDDDLPPLVSLSVNNSSIAEAAGVATFTASLANASSFPVTVDLGFSGTATNIIDYTRSGTQIVIPAGMTAGSIAVTAVQDLDDEPDETVVVEITSVTNGTEDGTQQATTTITDDDGPPSVSLSVTPATIAEGGGVATFTATLSGTSFLPITVDLGFSGTATEPADYTRSGIQIVIPPGISSGTITVTAVQDLIDELDETVIVEITSVTNGVENGNQQATTTIIDDELGPLVSLSLDSPTVAEAAGVATVTATLSAVSSFPLTVNLLFGGTATFLADYSTSGLSIVIPPGDLTGSFLLTAAPDLLDELDETVTIDIGSVINGTENGTQQVITTIVDDDAPPAVSLSVDNATIPENAGIATFTATLLTASGLPVTVDLGFTGTAADGLDYFHSSSQIVIPAGATTGTLTVTALQDPVDELDETVIVDITGITNATAAGIQQATTTVTDDDLAPLVTLAVNNSLIVEAGGVATFTATLSTLSGLPVTVDLGFAGSATAGADYVASTPQIVIPAGSLSGNMTVTAVQDLFDEPGESAIVSILGVINGTEDGTQQVTTTIGDDDAPPTVSLSVDSGTIAEAGGIATFTGTLSAISGFTVTINLVFTGTATNFADYSRSGTQIVIPAGSLSGTVTVLAVPDALHEINETVIVDIASVFNGTESGIQQVTTTIVDDDLPPTVTLSVNNATIVEAGGTANFTVSLSAISSLPVTVNLGFTGAATSTADYSSTGTQIVIPAGSGSGAIVVSAVQDLLDELDESVDVEITSVINGTEAGTQVATTTIVDDDLSPTVALSVDNPSIGEGTGIATFTATLSAPSGLPVTIDLAFSGAAVNGVDYTHGGTQLVIPAGETSGALLVSAVQDALDEFDEPVVIDILSVTQGTESGIQQATTLIIDDDAQPSVTLTVDAPTIPEAGGVATFTATLSAPSGLPVTIDLAIVGAAISSVDYAASAGQIVIPAGSTSGTITITAIQDLLDEFNEGILVDILSTTNGIENGVQQSGTTIIDDDVAPTVNLTLSHVSIAEATGTATFTVALSAVSGLPVTVDLALSGSATHLLDFAHTGVQIVIPAGATDGSLVVTAIQDPLDELNETVFVEIGNIVNAIENGVQQATTTILDDDTAPSVSLAVNAVSLAEASGTATVTATLSAPSGLPVTIEFFTGGTAANLSDFTHSGLSIVIPAGSTSGTISFTSVQDLIDEFPETILVDISAVTNGTEDGIQQVTITIADDDDAPSVFLATNDFLIPEAAGSATFTANLSSVSGLPVTVDFALRGMATLATDFFVSTMQVVIPAGSASGSITVTSLPDLLNELDETVIAEITQVVNGLVGSPQPAIITILNDDPQPTVTLSVDQTNISEANGVATFTVNLSAVSALPVEIELGFSGLASASDFTSSVAMVVVPAGSTVSSFTVTATSDSLFEANETVIVDLIDVFNGIENGVQQAATTLTDDDALPTVELTVNRATITEATGVATFTATLSVPSGLPVLVDLGFVGGATPTIDYARSGTQIEIPPGSLSGALSVTAIQDARNELDESVSIQIVGVTNAVGNGLQTATTTIVDDDADPGVLLSINQSTITEGAGAAIVTVTLSSLTDLPVTIDLTFSGTAIPSADFAHENARIVIPPGGSSGTMTVTGIQDPLFELDESLVINVAAVSNGTISEAQAIVATITDDDSPPQVSLSGNSSAISETSGLATVTATLSAVSALPVTVDLAFSGNATIGSDYVRSGSQIVILPGSISGTINVTSVQDVTDEIDEAIEVEIVSVAQGVETGQQQATVFITDDDLPPTVSLSTSASDLVETAGSIMITASLSLPSSLPVVVDLSLDGSASTIDYTHNGLQIVIPPGSTSGSIVINALSDQLDEFDETIVFAISGVANGSEFGDQQVVVMIIDDDAPPSVVLAIGKSTIAEAGESTTITATLSKASGLPITVDLALRGTASLTDYLLTANQIVIPAGGASGSISITAAQDSLDELAETVIVEIVDVINGTENGIQQVTTTVEDDDGLPTVRLSVEDPLITESGATTRFIATLSAESSLPVTVDFDFRGTAIRDHDYAASSQQIVIPAGSQSGMITVTTLADPLNELEESVIVEIASVTNGTEDGTQLATASIADDDPPPTVSLSISSTTIAEANGSTLVTASLSAPSSLPITVDLSFSGSAANVSDYSRGVARIVIAAGSTSGTITITALQDDIDEPEEGVIVEISAVVNGAENGTQQVAVTISDDDPSSDFGDAPTSYATTLADDGPRHLLSALFLGSAIDPEFDGQPDAQSGTGTTGGDDHTGLPDDEDGVLAASSFIVSSGGTTASLLVTASAAAKFDAWIDFNRNGRFDHPTEHLGNGTSATVAAGENVISFGIPPSALFGQTAARYRLSTRGNLLPTGPATDGEVEDGWVSLLAGSAAPIAQVRTLGTTTVDVVNNEVVVRSGETTLFRAPIAQLGDLKFVGSDANETLQLRALPKTSGNRFLLQWDAAGGTDSLAIVGTTFPEIDLTKLTDNALVGVEQIDLSSSIPTKLIVNAGALPIPDLDQVIRVVLSQGDQLVVESGWRVAGTAIEEGEFAIRGQNGTARVDLVSEASWHNAFNPLDVDGSGQVTTLDALLIVNELNFRRRSNPEGLLVDAKTLTPLPTTFLDVNRDGLVTPLDALLVINALNRASSQGELIVLAEPEEQKRRKELLIDQAFADNDGW